jgi:hypothetical protein
MDKHPRKRLAKETRTTYQATRSHSNRRNKLQRIVRALRARDPDIIEIVQFGSSVYAPRLARDVDLMITTRAKKNEDVYWDAVSDWAKNVDLVVREPGQKMGDNMALGVFVFSKSIFGNGRTRKEAKEFMRIPTYDDAWMYFAMADKNLGEAHHAKDERYREAYYCLAFDLLFDAARYAAMTFLATSETRWGELPKRLPTPFNTQFRGFISKLHVQFSYDRNYPKDKPDEAFQEWRDKVSAFIDALSARSTAKDK